MPIVAILGCDGSGKSSVIDAVLEQLAVQGIPARRYHWRPTPFSGAAAGASRRPANDPHGSAPCRGPVAWLKILWIAANWWVGWWTDLRHSSRRGIAIFDRYHQDLIIDPLRYRYGGPLWWAKTVFRCLPQPDLVILLDADPAVLRSRKQEVDAATLEVSAARYRRLVGGIPGSQCVDASEPLEQVIEQVSELVMGVWDRR